MQKLLRVETAVLLILAISGALFGLHPAQAGSIPANPGLGPPYTSESDGARLLATRIRNGLPADLYADFDLFIYVNKADRGPSAQHMYVFAKPSGDSKESALILMQDWPVSTGRESIETAKDGERVSTGTPEGFFELRPDRFYTEYRSRQWQLNMPNAMFFDWQSNGRYTGLAIHGVTDTESVSALGHRASAGCIQMSLEASKALFDLVRDSFEGQVPRFAYDQKRRVTSSNGEFARDASGNVVMVPGYRALLMIDNSEGGTLTSGLLTAAPARSG